MVSNQSALNGLFSLKAHQLQHNAENMALHSSQTRINQSIYEKTNTQSQEYMTFLFLSFTSDSRRSAQTVIIQEIMQDQVHYGYQFCMFSI